MVPEDLFTCSTSRYIFEKKARLTSSWFFFASNSFPGWLSGDGPSGKGPMHQAAAPGLNGLNGADDGQIVKRKIPTHDERQQHIIT